MAVFTAWIEQFSDVLWNSLLLFLLVGTGVYFRSEEHTSELQSR